MTPFEIIDRGDCRVATNGSLSVLVFIPGANIFRRRAVSGIRTKPPAEVVIPQLNALAGDLLANGGDAQSIKDRILAIAGTIVTEEPTRSESAVVETSGVRVIATEGAVIVMEA